MAEFSLQGVNRMLFDQMERLAAASSPEEREVEIERSRSMSSLANSAVAASNAMLSAARMQAQAQTQLACAVTMETTVPAALMGQVPEASAPSLPEPDDDEWAEIDAFLAANASAHSASWLVDRIRTGLGVEVDHEDVKARCESLGVEPVELGRGRKRTSESMSGMAR